MAPGPAAEPPREPEPELLQAEAVEPEPPTEAPRHSRSRPKPQRAEPNDPSRELARVLSTRHLDARDLEAAQRFRPLLAGLREAQKSGDARGAAGALEQLLRALPSACDDDQILRSRLARIRKALTELPSEKQSKSDLEKRYLDLKTAGVAGLSPGRCEVLLAQAEALEVDLSAAARK
jgi:hypothetical protein